MKYLFRLLGCISFEWGFSFMHEVTLPVRAARPRPPSEAPTVTITQDPMPCRNGIPSQALTLFTESDESAAQMGWDVVS